MKITYEHVARRVMEAYWDGRSIAYGRGPLADRRAKRALGLTGSRSQVCTAIKEAVQRRLIEVVVTDRWLDVYCGDTVRRYPVVELRPAPLLV